jgi:hypothetical protein
VSNGSRKSGIDYLIFDELVAEKSNVSFNNLERWTTDYVTFSDNIRSINSLVLSNESSTDIKNQLLMRKIADQILGWINAGQLNTLAPGGDQKSRFRLACFLVAAKPGNEKFAADLFSLMCLDDKLKDPRGLPDMNYINILIRLRDAAIDRVIYGLWKSEGNNVFENSGNSTYDFKTSQSGYTNSEIVFDLTIDKTTDARYALSVSPGADTGTKTSLGIAHRAVRETETALGITRPAGDFRVSTSYSNSISRDARAFVVYKFLLNIMSNFNFRVNAIVRRQDDNNLLEEARDQVRNAVADFYSAIGATTESIEAEIRPPQPDVTLRMRFQSGQFEALKRALEKMAILPQNLSDDSIGNTTPFDPAKLRSVTRKIHSSYVNAGYTQLDISSQISQNLCDSISQHAQILKSGFSSLDRSMSDAKTSARKLEIRSNFLQCTQREQAELMRYHVSRYRTIIDSTSLPTAVDISVGQIKNTKTVIKTHPVLSNVGRNGDSTKQLIAIGIPTGCIESLRYKNTLSTQESNIDIILQYKNVQLNEDQERDNKLKIPEDVFKFSTRLFIDEGSKKMNSADSNYRSLKTWEDVFKATRFKVFGDSGKLASLSYDEVLRIFGQEIVNNHLLSYYSGLLLKSFNGIIIDETVFNMGTRIPSFVDRDKAETYKGLVISESGTTKYISSLSTEEGRQNIKRIYTDVSRSYNFSADLYQNLSIAPKVFERIFIIPVDLKRSLSPNTAEIFVNVFSRVRLSKRQIAEIIL